MTEEHLLLRCGQRDRCAFDELCGRYQQRIVLFIYARTGDIEASYDIAQEAFLRAWLALVGGTTVVSFASWLFQISRNLTSTWLRSRLSSQQTNLDEEHLTLPSHGPSVEELSISASQSEFLKLQLDEVLILMAPTPEAKRAGLIRKLSFIGFYVDGLTLRELQTEMAIHARAIGLVPPTFTQLNNWLCRGDILLKVVRHLIQEHSSWIRDMIGDCLRELGLPEEEHRVAAWRWCQGWAIDLIAERGGISISEVSQSLRDITGKIELLLMRRLKGELHASRR